MGKIQQTDQKTSTFNRQESPFQNLGYLGGVKAQILANNPRAIVFGDCAGHIRNVTIHSGSIFHLEDSRKTLEIVDSTIYPKAQVFAGSNIEDANVHGTMRGGNVKNTTLRASGEMNDGLATDADIYGLMNGGYIHKSTICRDGIVSKGDSFNNQNIGIKVPFLRMVKDTVRSGVYGFFNTTQIGKGKMPEVLPAYDNSMSDVATSSQAPEKKPLLKREDSEDYSADKVDRASQEELLPAYEGQQTAPTTTVKSIEKNTSKNPFDEL